MPELNPEHLKAVINIINGCPFFRLMSMQLTEIGVGWAKVAVEMQENHKNPFGDIHGGVYASAIDTAAYWSAYCDLPEGQGLTSIDLKIDLLATANPGTVVIRGKRLKCGKTLYLAEAAMFDSKGKLLAHGTSKMLAIHHRQTIKDVAAYMGADVLPIKFTDSSDKL